MENNGSFKTVVMEDGSHTVVRTDPRNPRLLEVIAIFYDAARARDYVDFENKRSAEQPEIVSSCHCHSRQTHGGATQ